MFTVNQVLVKIESEQSLHLRDDAQAWLKIEEAAERLTGHRDPKAIRELIREVSRFFEMRLGSIMGSPVANLANLVEEWELVPA